jgi:hypothetical protein
MSFTTVPSLKRPSGSKAIKKWVEEIALFVSNNMSLYHSQNVRSSTRDKIINIDLYNNKIHAEDFVGLLNPLDLKIIEDTREIQHFPVAASIIDLFVGEEIDRPYEPMVDIINNIGIDEKKERLRAYVEAEIKALEEDFEEGDEEDLKTAIQKLTRKLKYTYKDIKEKKASALLEDYYSTLNIEEKFVEGFRRVWLTGEEAYEIDIVNGEPVFEIVNTANMRVYGGGRSSHFGDYDLINIEGHKSPGYLIDRYGDKLTEEEVKRILNYETSSGLFDKSYGEVTHEFNPVGDILGTEISDNYIDDSGGIRHMRIRIKAYKQVKKVIYQDPTTGTEEIKVVANTYRMQEGEVLKEKVWITEWWIMTVIGADIIVDAHPIPIRYNRLSSLTEGHPGIVGRVYNINEREVVPPMTKIRSYQYLFDVVMDRLTVAMSKNIGPILEMDFAKKPGKWDTLKWLNYMFKYNTKFVDSFKEVNKGAAMGQLAGNLASGRDQMQHFDFSQYIQQLVSMAEYLEKSMADTLGAVPQRMGSVSNRETVGGIERATSQSSHITEWYFYIHEQVKLEALNVLIEAAKTALKDNPKKLKYTLDSKILEILDINYEDLANVDIGVTVTNAKKSKEYRSMLQQAAHAFMQNTGEFSFIFDVLNSNSMAEKRRLIEEYENDKKEQEMETRKGEEAALNAQLEANKADKDEDRKMKKYEIDTKNELELQIKLGQALIDSGELKVSEHKTTADIKRDILALQIEMEKNKKDDANTKRELDIKEKAVNKKAVTTT